MIYSVFEVKRLKVIPISILEKYLILFPRLSVQFKFEYSKFKFFITRNLARSLFYLNLENCWNFFFFLKICYVIVLKILLNTELQNYSKIIHFKV